MRIGSDTGGTFTDLVDETGRIVKVPSDPADPAAAVASGLESLGGRPELLGHGTTVATNALLEGATARVALVTNHGLADVIEIGRQDRPHLYDQTARRPIPLVAREDRYEIPGRLGPDGQELEPLDRAAVPDIGTGPDAVVVALLHADLDPDHEETVAGWLRDRGWSVTTSTSVTPEFREYERFSTAVVSAALEPVCGDYLTGLDRLADDVLVLTSAGGLMAAAEAAAVPARLLLSGPAGGVAAGAAAAVEAGFDDAVTFDMGGTSTDVCLVLDGRPAPAAERSVADRPVRLPSLDVHTIGAGGGSVAWIDAGGALRVGPQSAGAVPGPACYGRGGDRPTVTDAQVVAGRIDADVGFDALGGLDVAAAGEALSTLGAGEPESVADDVIRVVEAAMVGAVRRVSVERGVDPAGLALVAFGGAGPLHALPLAEELGMAAVVVPARAGVLSAVGVLTGDEQVDVVESMIDPLDHRDLDERRRRLEHRAADALGPPSDGVVVSSSIDARYAGQSHELNVTDVRSFPPEHRRRNGFDRPDVPIEIVAVRARARRRSPVQPSDLPAVRRDDVTGPATVMEGDTTIHVPAGWRGRATPSGSLVLRRAP